MVRGAVVVLLIAASTFCSTSALSANPLPTKVCAVGGYDKWTIGGYKLVRQERQKVLDALVAQVTKKLKPSNLGTNKPFKVSELQPFGKDCSLNDGYCTKIIDGCSKAAGAGQKYKFSTMLEYTRNGDYYDENDYYYYYRVNMEGKQNGKTGKVVLGKWTYQDVTNYD